VCHGELLGVDLPAAAIDLDLGDDRNPCAVTLRIRDAAPRDFGANLVDEISFGIVISVANASAFNLDDWAVTDVGLPGPSQVFLPYPPPHRRILIPGPAMRGRVSSIPVPAVVVAAAVAGMIPAGRTVVGAGVATGCSVVRAVADVLTPAVSC